MSGAPLRAGEILHGRYRILRPLGEGGMARAYVAEDRLSESTVALKVLRPVAPELRQAFEAEFARLSGLFHPHLARVHDFGMVARGQGKPLLYYTSELARGSTLDRWAAGRPWEQNARPVVGLLRALDFLHRLGLRHGDVKPANVLVDEEAHAVLIDLGCAAPIGAAETRPSGTPEFVAPEVLAANRADGRADLFGVGVLLGRILECSSGSVPKTIPPCVRRLTRPDPRDRPADVREVLEMLGTEVAAPGPPGGHSPTLLGRVQELQAFEHRLEALLSGRPGPRLLQVHGPDGIGRSRLLQQMKWIAQPRCMVVEGEVGRPAPIAYLLGAALERSVGSSLPFLLEAWEALRARGSPCVLLVDDVHRLEAAEHDRLMALARSIEITDPAILLLSGRAPLLPEGGTSESMAPPPLGVAEVERWTAGLVAPRHVPELHRLTGGLPARVAAVLAHLATGARTDSELDRAAAEVLAREGQVAPRLGTGSGEERCLAWLVVGDGVAGDRDVDDRNLDLECMLRLQERGWVVREGGGWRLARPADRFVLADALDTHLLRELHAEAATALEQDDNDSAERWADEESLRAARRARHLACAGDRAAAAGSLRAAASLVERAPHAWRRAAEAIEGIEDDPDLALAAARVHELAGQPRRALTLLARTLRRHPFLRRDPSWCHRVGSCYLKLGAPHPALHYLHRALAATRAGDAQQAVVLDLLSRTLVLRGQHAGALARAEEGLGVSDTTDLELRAQLDEDVGVAATYLDRPEVARHHFDRAEATHRGRGDPRAAIRLASYRAIVEARAGRPRAAVEQYRGAVDLAEQHGLDDQLATTAMNLGTALHELGDWGPALEAYERALALARALGKDSTEVTARFNMAELYLAIGALERAETLADRTLVAARQHAFGYLELAASCMLGRLAILRGRWSDARGPLEQGRDGWGVRGLVRERIEADLALAELCLGAGEPTRAAGHLDAAAVGLGEVGAADLEARASLVRGRWLLAQGSRAAGMTVLEEALEGARRGAFRDLEGEAHLVLSDAFEAGGAPTLAGEHRRSARTCWERIAASLPPTLQDAFWRHPLRLPVAEQGFPAGAADEARAPDVSDLQRILEINRRLNSSLSVDRVLESAIDAAVELTGAERGFVLVRTERDDGSTSLDVSVARNIDRERIGRSHLKFSRSIAERVVATGESILTTDAREDDRFRAEHSVHAMRLQSVLCVPIRSPDGPLGAIYLDNRFEAGRFRRRDVGALLAFADQLAIALTNARLHAALERRTQELADQKRRAEDLAREQARELDRLSEDAAARQALQQTRFDYGPIIGTSGAMRRVFAVLDRVIDSSLPVLVEGESGTGKELVARAIHDNGPRSSGRFVALNCAALPESLLEAELFGYRKGAFTGAIRDREGILASARGGTVLLDEVGEMPLAMQAKLLRALQEQVVRPLGAEASVPIDIRVVCATNRHLLDEVAAARFREDLYYRIAVVTVVLPPLRDRVEDIPLIARALLERLASKHGRPAPDLDRSAMRALLRHRWSGNVRELENVLGRALVMADGPVLEAADLQLLDRASDEATALDRDAFEARERRRILASLEATGWNVSEAARRLGIPRNTLYRRFRRYGIMRSPSP